MMSAAIDQSWPEDDIALPMALDAVTPDFLTAALAIRYPGTEVTNVTLGRQVRGSGSKVRLLLEYNDAGHHHRLPPTLWFKGGYETHSDGIRNSHVHETIFYREIAPRGLVNTPRCYFAGVDRREGSPSFGHAGQLMEDLLGRNASFGHASRSLSVEQVSQLLTMFARLHAHWWNAPELARLGPIGGSLRADGIVLRQIREGWNDCARKPMAADLPVEMRGEEAALRGMALLSAYDAASKTLCVNHGDPHPANLFFEPDGAPGLLDWQRLMQCDWGHDVTYFTIGAMEPGECARHERDLLAHYLRELSTYDVAAPDFDAAWLSYRKHAMYGLVWVVVPPKLHRIEAIEIMASRFCAAFRRLRTYDVLFSA